MRSSSGPGIVSSDVRGRDEQHVRQVEVHAPGSGRGTCGSAPGRAPRAGPTTGRPASRCRACRSRRAGSPGSSCRRRSGARTMRPGGRRHRCAGGRGSRPRRGCRPAARARTCGPSARATDSPSDVLPTPGGPTRARIAPGPRRSSGAMPRSRAQLAHRQELEDALLHVVQAGVVGVEDVAGRVHVEALVGLVTPHGSSSTSRDRCGSSPLGVCAPVRSSRSSSRSTSLRTSSGRSMLGDPLAVLVDLVGVAVVAELLADGVELPAQDELALAASPSLR